MRRGRTRVHMHMLSHIAHGSNHRWMQVACERDGLHEQLNEALEQISWERAEAAGLRDAAQASAETVCSSAVCSSADAEHRSVCDCV